MAILGTEGALRIGYLRETPLLLMTPNTVAHDTVPYFMERFGIEYRTSTSSGRVTRRNSDNRSRQGDGKQVHPKSVRPNHELQDREGNTTEFVSFVLSARRPSQVSVGSGRA